MELRVSYEAFAKKAPGHPAAPDPGEAPEGEAEAEAEEGGRRRDGAGGGANYFIFGIPQPVKMNRHDGNDMM